MCIRNYQTLKCYPSTSTSNFRFNKIFANFRKLNFEFNSRTLKLLNSKLIILTNVLRNLNFLKSSKPLSCFYIHKIAEIFKKEISESKLNPAFQKKGWRPVAPWHHYTPGNYRYSRGIQPFHTHLLLKNLYW